MYVPCKYYCWIRLKQDKIFYVEGVTSALLKPIV